jgi:homoserine O-acetyltransferase
MTFRGRGEELPGEAPVVVLDEGSVGVVEPRSLEIPGPFVLEGGATLPSLTVAYETYGRPNAARDNVVLVEHALSASAHAAGRHRADDPLPGWWDAMIGPGRAIDTERHFVVCSNLLGSCYGTTGPSSRNPRTGRPYGSSFPRITIGDMVEVQYELVRRLGIQRLRAVVGGSMGGMIALEWALRHPELVDSLVLVATAARATPLSIAIHKVGLEAIFADPNWRGGDYYGAEPPRRGLAIARMLGHVTYLSDGWLWKKFGRRRSGESVPGLERPFEIERYLEHQGRRFVERFDAGSYVALIRAIDLYDAAEGWPNLVESFRRARCRRVFVASFTSDWLYPSYQAREIVEAFQESGADVEYHEIESDYGHDSFLLRADALTPLVRRFLESVVARS